MRPRERYAAELVNKWPRRLAVGFLGIASLFLATTGGEYTGKWLDKNFSLSAPQAISSGPPIPDDNILPLDQRYIDTLENQEHTSRLFFQGIVQIDKDVDRQIPELKKNKLIDSPPHKSLVDETITRPFVVHLGTLTRERNWRLALAYKTTNLVDFPGQEKFVYVPVDWDNDGIRLTSDSDKPTNKCIIADFSPPNIKNPGDFCRRLDNNRLIAVAAVHSEFPAPDQNLANSSENKNSLIAHKSRK
jgi:hypothetical protein